ncbi:MULTISPECIES: TetR/AcrR family transcriptional regulator [unclassified Wenzhouxiangella]|uniref:TetR/AcrR family transcriptional regulator n=1 Tax=unclassified Wenzhouxiangella TaxID=2613841 RepID=UPI000E32BD58|nr:MULTISPECIES: TetR/AcrR family transcriptional regulator [unclassified Wenzhouxiangella]RFF28457.1 TetR/AcrR family transcriptional regulator [Wenzhouxiangella sp. 15181]RFP69974.1 TetR/AcrR family transcriptional regulator [Wenzhouxiangella sp. 15190]
MNESIATRDPDLTQARILDAAFDLFVDKGFAAVSMRELAERSGVTKSLIHHHFGTKEGLWDAVKEAAFARYYEGQKDELEGADSPDPELLKNGVTRYFRFLQENPQVVRLFTWMHLEGDTTCNEMDAELVELGARRVREAQDAGLLRSDVNPTHVVTVFINACSQWFEVRPQHKNWEGIGSDDEYLDDFLKIFMDGLAPRATGPETDGN